jgi:hypothetical protein
MSTVISGIVTGGVIVPNAPLPEGTRVEIHLPQPLSVPAERMTATEIRRLPRDQRQALLAAAAAMAEQDYREDKNLTGFDAFSEELDDDSA